MFWNYCLRAISAYLLISCISIACHADETIDTPDPWDWHIEFQPEDPSDNDYCPFGRARLIGEATHDDDGFPEGEPGGYIDGYTAYGFPEPDINGQNIEVDSYQGAPARANPDRIQVKALTCKSYDRLYLYEVTGHELFHGVEYAYTCGGPFDLSCGIKNGLGDLFVEGHAQTMQGKVFDKYEPTPSDDLEFYTDKAMGTNVKAREQIRHHIQSDLRKRVYASTGWWLYLTKEYGHDQTMPGYGVDLLHAFWVNAGQLEEPASGIHVLEQTLDDYGVDESLEEIHRRFGVTAMIRDFDFEPGVVPDESVYRFPQEEDAQKILFGFPKDMASEHDLSAGPGIGSDSVQEFGVRYHFADVSAAADGSCAGGVVGYLATGENIGDTSQTVVFMDSDDQIVEMRDSGAAGMPAGQYAATVPVDREFGDYIRAVLVVATGVDGEKKGKDVTAADFDYTFACGPAAVEIKFPDSGANPPWPVFAGLPDAPERILVRVRVTGPPELSETSVLGLNKDQFTVWIGDESDPRVPANEAEVLTAYQAKGEYILIVQPPDKPGAAVGSVHDLVVKLGDEDILTGQPDDTEADSVIYDEQAVDMQLVIDHSGSMTEFGKMDAARAVAKAFVDWAQSDDQIGVTEFADTGDVIFQLDEMSSQAERDLVQGFIDVIFADGETSIGGGLNTAWNDILNNARPNPGDSTQAEHWMLLLSDGYENTEPWTAQVMPSIAASGTLVHTIALGSASDQNLMQWIADHPANDEPKGRFEYIPDPEESPVEGGAMSGHGTRGGPADVTSIVLADTYRTMFEDMHDYQRLWERTGSGAHTRNLVLEEDNITEMVLSLFWDNASSPMTLTLTDPDGNAVTETTPGARVEAKPRHHVIQLDDMPPGEWTIDIAGDGDYHAALSGRLRDGVQMELLFGQFHQDANAYSLQGDYLPGLPMPVIALLTDAQGAIVGAQVSADIRHPDGSVHTLQLHDDGAHYDGIAGDGVYANHYQLTSQGATTGYEMDPPLGEVGPGSYKVDVTAAGTNNSGQAFNRIGKSSFHLLDHPELMADQEPDGLMDRWEDRFDCVDSTVMDATEDPDADQLTTREELFNGTDPCNMDTDFGGEPDGSEVTHGRDPRLKNDDYLAPLDDVEVITHLYHTRTEADEWLTPNGLTLRFGLHPSYEEIEIHRRIQGQTAFNLLTTINAADSGGIHKDLGLTPGTTYEYYGVPVALNGVRGAPSAIFGGTARSDAVPPTGDVLIDGGNPYTDDASHHLTLAYSDDAVDMRISRDPDFPIAAWQPVSTSVAFTALPDDQGIIDIHAQFRDAEGNVSLVMSDTILHDGSQNYGNLQGSVSLTPSSIVGGQAGTLVSAAGIIVIDSYTDSNGDFLLENLPEGEYTVEVQRFGYQALPVVVNVGGGGRGDADLIAMHAVDSDNDGMWDIDEFLNGTDRWSLDSDGDGLQDGTELGWIEGVSDPDGGGPLVGTDTGIFIPDADPATLTDPLEPDSDGDGFADGVEDGNHNGRVDPGETDPLDPDSTPLLFRDGFEG